MSIELKIPEVGESVREVQIGRWLKREGDNVALDENVVELETDKASMELAAPAAGVLGKGLKKEGDMVAVGDVIAYVEEQDSAGDKKPEPAQTESNTTAPPLAPAKKSAEQVVESAPEKQADEIAVSPAARRALREHGLHAADISARGPTLRTDDVFRHLDKQKSKANVPKKIDRAPSPTPVKREQPAPHANGELEEVVPMSLIRRRIAERLVSAQQQAALLTTFNEIDMTAIKELRAEYRDAFQAKYGTKLGFMSFFVKAVVD